MTQMFRQLSPAEQVAFRQWARDNYKPLTPIMGVWHPVIQDECRRMNEGEPFPFNRPN